MKDFPKISIVTPTFNQGKYIEETILSVIGQQYPNLEYIIIDGGSTDGTIEIIKKYERYLAYWVSEKDKGQSHAINKGFNRATGDILGWLNSDDLYLPSTLSFIAGIIDVDQPAIHFGNCNHFKETPQEYISYGSNVAGAHANSKLTFSDYIIQPSSFWTTSTYKKAGPLREDLHYGFDWEWFLRAERSSVPFYPVSKCLSMYRFHADHKTGTGGTKRQQELSSIYDMYSRPAGDLYRMLLSETLNLYSFKNRMLIRVLGKLNRPYSYSHMLKMLKPQKYADYTADEIKEVGYML
jgi:glycosyltransferase involved in cell wall biosynthesis